MKTSELTGYLLDWAVGKCEGLTIESDWWDWDRLCFVDEFNVDFEPTDNWMQGGAIIEREIIGLDYDAAEGWQARDFDTQQITATGKTPLEAAMRCYVASKLGDQVEVPDELISHAQEIRR